MHAVQAHRPSSRSRPWAGIALALLAACSDGSGPPQPAALAPTSAQEQSATVGTAVGAAPAVAVRDAGGKGIAGVPVTFAVASGGGTLGQASATTGADGVASALSWTLGTAAGAQSVTAQAAGLPAVTFTATARPDAPARVVAVAGAGQAARTGSAVPTPPAVEVSDRHGNPVPGVGVTFEVESGGGSVTGASATTDARGRAAVGGWLLGVVPGEQTLRARAGTLAASIAVRADLPSGCAPAAYQLGATIPAAWEGSDCALGDRRVDRYELSLAAQQAFRTRVTGPAGRAVYVRRRSDSSYVALMPGAAFAPPEAATLEVKYVLEPGDYLLEVASPAGAASGSYTLATTPETGITCRPIVFGSRGITVEGTIDPATDCRSPGSVEWYEDWLVMVLKTGDRLRLTLTSATMAPLLVWRDDRLGPASPTLATARRDTPGTVVIEWTATFDGFHEAVVTRNVASTPYGAYTLKVERIP